VCPEPEIDHRSGWPSLRSQHLDQEECYFERTAFLAAKGYRALRFRNGEVMNKIKDGMGVVLEERAGSSSRKES